jgi:hypothetical protein
MSPLCESYVPQDKLDEAEAFYPLHVRLCEICLLVQLPAYVPGEDIFSDYAYFSSYSDSWVAHAKRYADTMIGALRLTPSNAYARPAKSAGGPTARVKAVLEEKSAGLSTVADYEGFANGVPQIKSEFARPDDILVLPWNLQDKISWRLDYVQLWDAAGSPVPALQIV